MPFRCLWSSSVGLLQVIAIAVAGLAVVHAQPDQPPQRAPPAAMEKAPAGAPAVQIEDELWGAIKDSDGTRVFEEYLRQYPDGRHVAQARERLAGLQATAK